MDLIVEQHFQNFQKLASVDLAWAGFIPAGWGKSLGDHGVIGLPTHHLSRSALKEFCRTPSFSDEACFVTCMAWGGMHRMNGRTAWAERERWLPLINRLRNTRVSRSDAYNAFELLGIQGLGPAYFTKLIYFLRPCEDGYILDQWTGKSVSILLEPSFIKFDSSGHVSRRNTSSAYERFCVSIECLSKRLERRPSQTEELLFSRGGRSKHPWRQYVISNWKSLALRSEVSNDDK